MLVPKPEMPDKQFRLPWFLTALTATRYVSAVWREFGRFMLQSSPYTSNVSVTHLSCVVNERAWHRSMTWVTNRVCGDFSHSVCKGFFTFQRQ